MKKLPVAALLFGLILGQFCSKSREETLIDLFTELTHAKSVKQYHQENLFRTWQKENKNDGWTRNKKTQDRSIIVASHRERAVFRFGNIYKKNQVLTINLKPLYLMQKTRLRITLNGRELFFAPFDWADFKKIRLPVPKEHFLIGTNLLEFQRLPFQPGEEGKAWLAVRNIKLKVKGKQFLDNEAIEDSETRIFPKKKIIEQPLNTAISFTLKIPRASELVFQAQVQEYKEKSGKSRSLDVYLETASGESTLVQKIEYPHVNGDNKGDFRIQLSPFSSQIARLSFVFRGEEPAATRLHIGNPRILRSKEEPEAHKTKNTDLPIQEPFNILIYLIDCLRPDHLPFFGYDINTAPHMTAFAEDSILFPNAYAQSSWTRTSVGALFTGLHPFAHRAITLKSGLDDDLKTLAEFLSEAGYYAAGISSNAGIKEFFNFHQGFSYFKYHSNLTGGMADTLNTYAFEQLRMNKTPFFLYIHTMEPHRPYKIQDEFMPSSPTMFAEGNKIVTVQKPGNGSYEVDLTYLISQYDAAIRQNDKAFGDLIAELKKLDLYDSTLIVLMSDHGEEFYEHEAFAHGQHLYQETVKNLFAVKLPGQFQAGTTIPENIQEINLVPTILDMIGQPVPSYMSGKSMKRLWLAPGTVSSPFHDEIFLETGLDLRLKAVVAGRWKLIHESPEWTDEIKHYELYDLLADPSEKNNIYSQNPIAAEYLKKRLTGWAGAQSKLADIGRMGLEKTLTEQEIEELKALGYIK